MIYSRQIRLEGQEADNFLEASGITICDDEIIIEDAVVEFDAAIEHLAENGISLYEDCIILEGKQAEEYKARKAKEREELDRSHRNSFGMGWKNTKSQLDSKRNGNYFAYDQEEKANKLTRKEWARLRDHRNNYSHGHNGKESPYTDKVADMVGYTKANSDHMRIKNNMDAIADAKARHIRRHPKQYSESTIFDSVELTGIDEQVFFRYKKDSQGLLHAEAKKLAGIVNGIDLSDDSHLSKHGIHIDKIEYADDSFILRRKFNVKIHFGYYYKIKSEDIDYEVVEKLMDAILAKAGYRKYGRYSVKKCNGYLFAIDYQDIYIEESDRYYTVNYGTGDMPMTSGMTSRAHTPEQRYIDIDIKCIEDTPGNMSLLRK